MDKVKITHHETDYLHHESGVYVPRCVCGWQGTGCVSVLEAFKAGDYHEAHPFL